jgi:hypothetical protein
LLDPELTEQEIEQMHRVSKKLYQPMFIRKMQYKILRDLEEYYFK